MKPVIASNLGQILGRFMMGNDVQRRATYRTRALKVDGVAGTIRKVLRALPPGEALSTFEIAARTDPKLTVSQVQTNVPYMPDVERVGTKRPHGYRMAE